jgi:pimeloyl-ACP methyl ester carboxylesterase
MTDIVLVHGAWHGGWCWARLRPLLEARGHRVWTPTLTGLGELAGLATPEVGLQTHVTDLVRLLEAEDLVDAVIVAHSYAGIPVTVVADRCGERLAAVIYLDSGRPRNGETANAVFPGSDVIDPATSGRAPWLIPVPADETFGITSEDDLAWLRANLTPHPSKTFHDPVHLQSQPPLVPSAAIICTLDGTADSAAARSVGDVPTIWIEAGHDAMITNPTLVAQSIMELLQRLT